MPLDGLTGTGAQCGDVQMQIDEGVARVVIRGGMLWTLVLLTTPSARMWSCAGLTPGTVVGRLGKNDTREINVQVSMSTDFQV